jgi:hypothetical protein
MTGRAGVGDVNILLEALRLTFVVPGEQRPVPLDGVRLEGHPGVLTAAIPRWEPCSLRVMHPSLSCLSWQCSRVEILG